MKNIIYSIFLSIILFGFTNEHAQAQKKKKPFNGIITYEITYSGREITPAEKAQMPSSVVEKILGNKSKAQYSAGGMTQIMITNGDKKEMIMIFVGPQGRAHMKLNEDEINEYLLNETEIDIKVLEETKEIEGYTCKKAEVTEINDKGEERTYFVYFSEKLGSQEINFAGKYSKIDGLMMEYQETQGDLIMHFKAVEVKKKKVKDIEFLIPSDSYELAGEEKQNMLEMIKQSR